jgi:hypothetical protein
MCRVRLTIGVDDETRYTIFKGFDHVMIDVAEVDYAVRVSVWFIVSFNMFNFFFLVICK